MIEQQAPEHVASCAVQQMRQKARQAAQEAEDKVKYFQHPDRVFKPSSLQRRRDKARLQHQEATEELAFLNEHMLHRHAMPSPTEKEQTRTERLKMYKTECQVRIEKERFWRERARGRGKPLSEFALQTHHNTAVGIRSAVDQSKLAQLFQINGVPVTNELISETMKVFARVVPTKTSMDMNQFDIIFQRIGFQDPFIRHRIFKTFDVDNSGTIDQSELIWGMSLLYPNSTASEFEALWKELGCGAGLDRHELVAVLRSASKNNDAPMTKGQLLAAVDVVFRQLDADQSGVIDYEEFQVGLIEDRAVAKLFEGLLVKKTQAKKTSTVEDENEKVDKESAVPDVLTI